MLYFPSILAVFALAAWATPLPHGKIHWVKCQDHVPATLTPTGTNLDYLPEVLHCGRLESLMD